MSERLLQPADPGASFRAQEDEIRAAIDRVLASGRYILGLEVEAFESEFSAFLGGGYTIGVANGTDALEIALRTAGVGPGDLVATVANTVSATASAIDATGASSVFVEVDADTMLMSASALEGVLARKAGRVKAVVPVHLYGHPVDMPHITAVSARYGAMVVEDCAQAHGAASGGRSVGTWGELAAFSFYPTKNLGALGDAGAVFTRDSALAERATLLRQYGWRTRYVSETSGRNSRLDELQAAILRVKLETLDAANEYRRHLAARYMSRLSDAPLTLPASSAHAVYHQFAIRISDRDAMQAALLQRGIACAVLYPVPLHRQPAWLDEAVSLPVTEQACDNVLCLPCHPGLKLEDVDRVCDAIVALAAGTPHTFPEPKP